MHRTNTPAVLLIAAWFFIFSSSQCAAAFAVRHSLSSPMLLRRAAFSDSTMAPGMSSQAAHALATGLIVIALLVGVVFMFRRSRTWYQNHHPGHHHPVPNLPPFLRNRPMTGAIPIVASPRTYALVSQNPAAYRTPSTAHAVPHYISNFHSMNVLVPPPPAYSSVASQRV